ncbi:MAG: N-acetylmuramoyl-L-alanine amidase [Candidatus Adiutrix sp.]|jgi:N-acetylmuramoyl-L-alanine amidase|nr:N-acetylmuramoyl-L-alanine amidase [Candidatus Adiutrix sp.]
MRRINYIAIHCSATRANVDEKITLPGEDIGVAEIRRWHTDPKPKGRGWRDIGYHYVIRRDGSVETGRPLDEVGAHVAGYNSSSVGVCLVGGVSEDGKSENNFEPPQWEALKILVASLKKRFPAAKIQGHRDFPRVAKDCPCFDTRAWAAKEGLA